MQKKSVRPYQILFLPKWFPGREDPQLGVFLRKHARAVSHFCNVHVLYVTSCENIDKGKYEIVRSGNEKYGETIVYVRKNESRIFLVKRLVNFIRFLRGFWLGYKTVRKEIPKPDLHHVHILGRTGVMALFLKLRQGIPYMVSEQWSAFITERFAKRNFLYKWALRKVIKHADLVSAVSGVLRESMQRYGFQNSEFHVVPNIVEISKKTGKIEKNSEKVLILTVGDLFDDVKNISGTIKAVENAVKKGYTNFEFHVIGGGYDRETLEKMARTEGLLNKYVFFYGRRPNTFVLDFMQKIDFLITNSNFETFSVVTAEALATGKPVISTRCGGPESFVTEKSGILVDVGNQQQLNEALIQMLENYQKFNAEEIKKSVIDIFSEKAVGEKFYTLYIRLLN